MKKDFDNWNKKKKELESADEKFLFKTGDIWWCTVGLNVRTESCGKGDTFRRPVLVLRKLSKDSFIGLPLSSQKKVGSWFCDITILNEIQYVLLYQIRMFSTNRLQRRLTTLDDNDFFRVKEKLEALLELSHNHQSRGSGSVGNPKSNISIEDQSKDVN
jgi:mRNA-degrading endonuclease toxin of MazEF toxin-antitoxin module